MRKPDDILFGIEDVPPPGLLAALAVQHVLVLSIFLATTVLVAQQAALPTNKAIDLISLTLIGLAAGSLLQVLRLGPSGAGLLVMPTAQGAFIPGCVLAARHGGMPMVAGLLLASSLCEIVLSRLLPWLRGVLPTELSGLIVLMSGLGLAQTGMGEVLDSMAASAGGGLGAPLQVAATTLAVMVGCSVWGRGPIRTLGAVAGLVCGYAMAVALGLPGSAEPGLADGAALLRLPSLPTSWPGFDTGLILPALLTGIVTTLNSVGALTAAQRLADAGWKRQDMAGLSRGLLADGLGTMVSAWIGGGGISASGSSVGLTATSRVTSRVVGCAAAAGFLVLALVPKFEVLVLAVPRPVLGAALIYLSCSLLVSGVSIMTSRLLDARKTFTLGIAFAFAVATPALTRAGALLPEWMSPVLGSPVLVGALVALLLNPILRLGIRQQVALPIPPGGTALEVVHRFVNQAGAAWGARREVIEQAQGPIAECLDMLAISHLQAGPARLVLGFNELALDVRISWRGAPLMLSTTRPTKDELLLEDDASARMAGYLIGRLASRVRSRAADGVAELHMVFNH